jgi:hypothetical protein
VATTTNEGAGTSGPRSGQYVLAYGSPTDGFEYVGPFDSHEAAVDYGETTRDVDWWVIALVAPISHLVHEAVEAKLESRHHHTDDLRGDADK